jgi:hypothetical protein
MWVKRCALQILILRGAMSGGVWRVFERARVHFVLFRRWEASMMLKREQRKRSRIRSVLRFAAVNRSHIRLCSGRCKFQPLFLLLEPTPYISRLDIYSGLILSYFSFEGLSWLAVNVFIGRISAV